MSGRVEFEVWRSLARSGARTELRKSADGNFRCPTRGAGAVLRRKDLFADKVKDKLEMIATLTG